MRKQVPFRWIIKKDIDYSATRPWQLWLQTSDETVLCATRSCRDFVVQVMDRLQRERV